MEGIKRKKFSPSALRDFDLVDRILEKKDDTAYAELLKIYKRSVYHVILKIVRNIDDAEDLTIESFTKAFKNINTFNKNFSFSTWLFRIATNRTIDFIRKNKLKTTSIHADKDDENSYATQIKDNQQTPEERTISAEKTEHLQQIVIKLPPKYQRLVKLRYFEELSYEEIAKKVNAPLGTIKGQLHRAKDLLQQLVKDKKHQF